MISLQVVTGPNCLCCALHPEDSASPVMLWVHSLYIAKVCETSSHLHVRETLMVRCCLVAHFGDDECLKIFLTRGLHLLQFWEDMSGCGQFNVLLVSPSLMDWTSRWETQTSNFTVSALPDCVRLESLEEISATFRIECFVVTRSS